MPKDYVLRYDLVFKTTFTEKNPIKRLLKETLDIEVINVKILNTELNVENKNEKRMNLDLIVDSDKGIFNIEVNNNYKKGLDTRNLLYFFKLVSRSIEKDDNYINISNYIQLNLTWNLQYYIDYDITNRKKLEYYVSERSTNKPISDRIKIVTCNMDYYLNKWYTNDYESENPFMMLLAAPSLKEMDIISRGDNLMEEITNKVHRLNIDEDFLQEIAIKNDEEKMINTIKKDAIQKGLLEGEEKAKIEIAKKMLDINMDIENISSITGLSIEEIEKLK